MTRKLRSAEYSSRISSAKLKNSKKPLRALKTQKPTCGSLRNAVVLAPFYTLKRCFQTKLVDLYSHEKLKKLNNKIKMSKKQNVSFEYNVVELKALDIKSKKKEPIRKRKPTEQKSKKKTRKSSKLRSYCQCDKDLSRGGIKAMQKGGIQDLKALKQGMRTRVRQNQPHYDSASVDFQFPVPVYNNQAYEKRRIKNSIFAAPKIDDHRRAEYFSSNGNSLEGTTRSISNISSKVDSWESFSDSLSFKEHLEGSLAISTTSIDSCLEQSEKHSVDYLDKKSNKTKSPRYNTRFKMIEELKRSGSEHVPGFPPKPINDDRRHLIINMDTKSSDERITDFMDREPQSEGITCTDIPQNLQPLPHLSRSKAKKQETEAIACKSYYLRSSRDGARPVTEGKSYSNQSIHYKENEGQEHRTLASTSRRSLEQNVRRKLSKSMSGGIEMLDDENDLRRKNVSFKVDDTITTDSKLDKHTRFLFLTPKTLEESYSQTEDIVDPFVSNTPAIAQSTPSSTLNVQHDSKSMTNNLTYSSCEVLHSQKSKPSSAEKEDHHENDQDSHHGSQLIVEENLETQIEKENDEGTENFWNLEITEPSSIEAKNSKEFPKESLSQTREGQRLESSSPVNRIRQPEDKDSTFIFGPRSSSARLGESCEYSFGLNCISDEEDSEQGDRFF